MGRGNVCVRGQYEGLFYIDNDDLHFYHNRDGNSEEDLLLMRDLPDGALSERNPQWEFDDFYTQLYWDDVIENFKHSIRQRIPSFHKCDVWISRSQHAILENRLFYIAIEDNEWSMAVELIQKEAEGDWYDLTGLQKTFYKRCLDVIRDVLFEQFDTLGVYGGAWTSGRIHRSDFKQEARLSTTHLPRQVGLRETVSPD